MPYFLFMLIIDMITPAVLFMISMYFIGGEPKKINSFIGFRTKLSVKNADTWRFANNSCGKLFLKISLISSPFAVILPILANLIGDTAVTVCGIAILLVEASLMLYSVKAVDKRLNENFNPDGSRK